MSDGLTLTHVHPHIHKKLMEYIFCTGDKLINRKRLVFLLIINVLMCFSRCSACAALGYTWCMSADRDHFLHLCLTLSCKESYLSSVNRWIRFWLPCLHHAPLVFAGLCAPNPDRWKCCPCRPLGLLRAMAINCVKSISFHSRLCTLSYLLTSKGHGPTTLYPVSVRSLCNAWVRRAQSACKRCTITVAAGPSSSYFD